MKQLQLLGLLTLLTCGTLQATTERKPLTEDEEAALAFLNNSVFWDLPSKFNIAVKNVKGNTKLLNIAMVGAAAHGKPYYVSKLIENGANPEYRNPETNSTIIHTTCGYGKGDDWAPGRVDCCEMLLSTMGKLINEVDTAGDSALHLAAARNNISTIEMLRNANADRNIRNNNGETAYDIAVKNRDLHLAAARNNISKIAMLLNANADKSIRNNNGETAYNLAMKKGYEEAAALLKPDPVTKQEEARAAWTRASIIGLVAAHVIFSNVG